MVVISTSLLTVPGSVGPVTELEVVHDRSLDTSLLYFPSTLRKLTFHDRGYTPRSTVMLPDFIEHLILDINYELECVLLPANLKTLEIGPYFNGNIKNISWPSGLIELILIGRFNQDIRNAHLPGTLRVLRLSPCFNQDIRGANLPPLTHLELGEDFNQDIRGAGFPGTLVHLTLGSGFSQELRGACLPQGTLVTLHSRLLN